MRAALVHAGLPEGAINLLAVPSELGLFDDAFHLGGQVATCHALPHALPHALLHALAASAMRHARAFHLTRA